MIDSDSFAKALGACDETMVMTKEGLKLKKHDRALRLVNWGLSLAENVFVFWPAEPRR
jgi:hypothetical protein